jgi:hypothetical protein
VTIELAFLLLAVPVIWALAEWRLALLLCLATAILQDPLRKLTPDQPVLFVAFVGVVFGAACLGAWARGNPLTLKSVIGRDRSLALALSILLLLIIVQAFNSYLRFDNLLIPLMGLATYLLPIPAIALAYQLVFRQGEFRINQFMKWYIVCIALVLTTVYLEFSGYKWPFLGQVGAKFIVFDQTGVILHASSGIFRASEIAAWHAATAACFVLLVAFLRRTTFTRLLTCVILATLLLGLGVLTSRRKIVIEFAVFVGTYFILWALMEKKVGKLAIITVTGAALVGYAWLASELKEAVPQQDLGAPSFSIYVERSQAVFRDVPSRFVELGIAPVMWAYEAFGLFGAGLGTGTQGTQHFAVEGAEGGVAAAAEGGLGKITVELGIPGLFVMGWLGIVLLRHVWQIMRAASRHSLRMGRLSFGLFSFLVANLAAFSVATQAYGDFFILLILSWTFAFLLAVPVLVEREVRARQLAIFEEPPSVFRPKSVVGTRI